MIYGSGKVYRLTCWHTTISISILLFLGSSEKKLLRNHIYKFSTKRKKYKSIKITENKSSETITNQYLTHS